MKFKKWLVVLCASFIAIMLIIPGLKLKAGSEPTLSPRSATIYVSNQYWIDGNTQLNNHFTNFVGSTGDGSAENPYIMENKIFDFNGYGTNLWWQCIHIDKYVIIRNNQFLNMQLLNPSEGLFRFEWAKNWIFENNTFYTKRDDYDNPPLSFHQQCSNMIVRNNVFKYLADPFFFGNSPIMPSVEVYLNSFINASTFNFQWTSSLKFYANELINCSYAGWEYPPYFSLDSHVQYNIPEYNIGNYWGNNIFPADLSISNYVEYTNPVRMSQSYTYEDNHALVNPISQFNMSQILGPSSFYMGATFDFRAVLFNDRTNECNITYIVNDIQQFSHNKTGPQFVNFSVLPAMLGTDISVNFTLKLNNGTDLFQRSFIHELDHAGPTIVPSSALLEINDVSQNIRYLYWDITDDPAHFYSSSKYSIMKNGSLVRTDIGISAFPLRIQMRVDNQTAIGDYNFTIFVSDGIDVSHNEVLVRIYHYVPVSNTTTNTTTNNDTNNTTPEPGILPTWAWWVIGVGGATGIGVAIFFIVKKVRPGKFTEV